MSLQASVLWLLRRARRACLLVIGRLLIVERGHISSICSARRIASFAPPASFSHQPLTFLAAHEPSHQYADPAFPRRSTFWPEMSLYRLRCAHLAGPRAVPLTTTRRIVSEHIGGREATILSQHDTLQVSRILFDCLHAPSRRIAVAYSISSPFAWNYFHWLTDCLPCLLAFEAIPEPATLLLPDSLSHWHLESLALMGYCRTSWESYDGDHIEVDHLYLSTWPKDCRWQYSPPHPFLLGNIRRRILASCKVSVEEHPEHVLIDRSRAAKRRIGNHQDIQRVFLQRGFVAVRLEDHTFSHQVSIFRSARCVAGVHGAGFTNLLFAERNPHVFEIFAQGDVHSFFPHLLDLVGGMHYGYVADSVTDGLSMVDPDQLGRSLDYFLSQVLDG